MKSLVVLINETSLDAIKELAAVSELISTEAYAIFCIDVESMSDEGEICNIAPSNVKEVYVLKTKLGKNVVGVLNFIKELVSSFKPEAIIFSDSEDAKFFASLLAGSLSTAIVTDVVDVRVANGKLILTKPLKEESIWGEFEVQSFPVVISIRSGSFGKKEDTRAPECFVKEIESSEGYWMEFEQTASEKAKLQTSKIIVGIGDGVRLSGTLNEALELSRLLNGEFGCTRPLVEAGIFDRERMIGLTGKKIRPKIYIALGVSGAPFHLSGIQGAELILTVNKEPSAPIIKHSDFYYIGDLKEVLPKLVEFLSVKKAP